MTEHVEHGGHAAEHSAPHVNYWMIFGALCILTVVSALADLIFGKGGESHAAAGHAVQSGLTGRQIALVLVVMAVAIAKALFVIMYFMHVKFSSKLVWVFSTGAFLWLGILLVLGMSDYLSRPVLQVLGK